MSGPEDSVANRYSATLNGIRAERFSATLPVALTVTVFLGLLVLFDALASPYSMRIAFVGALVFAGIWTWGWVVITRRKTRKALQLRQQLGALEQQETALRIEEARRAGKFDTWEVRS